MKCVSLRKQKFSVILIKILCSGWVPRGYPGVRDGLLRAQRDKTDSFTRPFCLQSYWIFILGKPALIAKP